MMTEDQRRAAFWAKVAMGEPGDCWPWMGAINGAGYGNVRWRGRTINASRVAFFLFHERWPNHACHTCDRKECVNPYHLYDGNKSTNQRDFHSRDPRSAIARERARVMVWSRRDRARPVA